jgi:hypothetical protein
MCGNGLITMAAAGLRGTVPMRPAATLLAHLGLAGRTTAEIEDLYSRPIATDVLPLVAGEHRAVQMHVPLVESPDREAA